MEAIVYTKFDLPDVLHLEEVTKPASRDDEVLIKVDLASTNSSDRQLCCCSEIQAKQPKNQMNLIKNESKKEK